MFDCIIPTAHAEQGVAYSFDGKTKLRRAVYREDDRPIDSNCTCATCKNYSRGYLHHLLRSHEPTAASLISIHNLHFYQKLTQSFREAIVEDRFMKLHRDLAPRLVQDDPEFPPVIPVKKKKRDPRTLRGYTLISDGESTQIKPPSPFIRHSARQPQFACIQEGMELCLAHLPSKTKWNAFDCETGDGSALMGLVKAFDTLSKNNLEAQLYVKSFSENLTALELALKNPGHCPHIRHGAPAALIKGSKWFGHSERLGVQHVNESFFTTIHEALTAVDEDQTKNAAHPLADLCIWLPFETTPKLELDQAERVLTRAYAHSSQDALLFCTDCKLSTQALLLLAGWNVYLWQSTSDDSLTALIASKKPSLLLEERSLPPDSSFLKKLCARMECDVPLREKLSVRSVWDKLSSHPQLVAWSH